MKIIISSIVLALVASCGGDKDKDEKAPPTEPATMVADDATAAADPAADPAASGDEAEGEIPTVTDFEQEVNEAITEDNLEKELEALEQEIGE
jgi:hypothetical protein